MLEKAGFASVQTFNTSLSDIREALTKLQYEVLSPPPSLPSFSKMNLSHDMDFLITLSLPIFSLKTDSQCYMSYECDVHDPVWPLGLHFKYTNFSQGSTTHKLISYTAITLQYHSLAQQKCFASELLFLASNKICLSLLTQPPSCVFTSIPGFP